MADGYKIWNTCPFCGGTGKNIKYVAGTDPVTGELQEVDCQKCSGKKMIFVGWCSVDTFLLPANLPEE